MKVDERKMEKKKIPQYLSCGALDKRRRWEKC